MNTLHTERVETFYTATKKFGRWTESREIEVRGRRGSTVLDLRALPAGDVEIRVDLDRSALKLLVPENAVVDQWDLRMVGRGKVKDWERPADAAGPRIRLVGEIRNGEVRIARGGVAVLTAMFSRDFIEDCKRANREGGRPTIHDPNEQ